MPITCAECGRMLDNSNKYDDNLCLDCVDLCLDCVAFMNLELQKEIDDDYRFEKSQAVVSRELVEICAIEHG